MTKIATSAPAAGTGTFTITAPASANNQTLTLPDQTGTVLTNVGPFTASSSASAGAVTIDASNNVGIGTSSPTVASGLGLVVKGGAGQVRFALKNNATTDGSGNGLQIFVDPYKDAQIQQNENAALSFATNALERARIDSSGNLLLNTTSTIGTTWLNVYGATSSKNGIAIQNSSDSGTVYSLFIRNTGGSTIGSINNNGSTTSFTTTSDHRLKEDVQPMTGALSKVAALKPCTYKWKADGSDGQGFIAHELQAVVPDCVTGEKDAVDAEGEPVYQGIDTSFLVATLTAAIQELNAKVDAQAAEIAALKGAAS